MTRAEWALWSLVTVIGLLPIVGAVAYCAQWRSMEATHRCVRARVEVIPMTTVVCNTIGTTTICTPLTTLVPLDVCDEWAPLAPVTP